MKHLILTILTTAALLANYSTYDSDGSSSFTVISGDTASTYNSDGSSSFAIFD